MILYHGSYTEVVKPDVTHSRRNVDFGPGFYTTPLREQAEKWCKRFTDKGQGAVVSVYRFSEDKLAEYKVLKFDSYSDEWLDFVLKCRRGTDTSDYDVVMGGVANDKVFNTVELFFEGLIDKTEAIKRLRYEKPNMQIAFRSQKIIDACLMFERGERL
ncbi:MAG: DUF3990 domain-containing protein [Lachnospiraceae bacterium]|nr:DUF3990 domain-containing protein [Lachnospiraceae bacterium]MBQ8547204.1 DUF3990 domain-containing protein [Lachnospiraceae bacterium]